MQKKTDELFRIIIIVTTLTLLLYMLLTPIHNYLILILSIILLIHAFYSLYTFLIKNNINNHNHIK